MVSGPPWFKKFQRNGFVKLGLGPVDGPHMGKPKVGEILLRAGLIDEMQLRAALGDQSNWGQRLGVTLVKMGLVEERDLVRALAQQLQLPVVSLDGKRVQDEVLELVPAEFAEKHLCVPLFVKENAGIRTLHLGMEDPCNIEALDDLAFRTGMKVQPVMVSPSELFEAIDRFYRRDGASSPARSSREIELTADGPPSAGVDATPIIHESLFRDVSEPAASSVAPEPVAAPMDGSGEASNQIILRALCQLLIEKGVIGRDELQERVRSLQEGEAD